MLLSRNDLIAILFRETDRAQRMKTPLAVIHCGITDWADWQLKLGKSAVEIAIGKIAERITMLLRCYDSVGQIADGELVLVLPGCNHHNAATMAERLHAEVFSLPLQIGERHILFGACFGVAASRGRSPFVVLRESERALQLARAQGTGAVQSDKSHAEPNPGPFVMTALEDHVGTR